MRVLYRENASDTIIFAAQELKEYLGKMLHSYPEKNWMIELESENRELACKKNDAYHIHVTPEGGKISGKNDRSVLLGVYDYLYYLGCRFPVPLKGEEIVPSIEKDKLQAEYGKEASCYHRGVCIEGADSFQNIMDYIEWLPKVGYNTIFLQFKTPYAFLARWYEHQENPYAEREDYAPEDGERAMELFEREAKRRGLMLHKAGHGWTGEVLGYQTVSWDTQKSLDVSKAHMAAEINGKRGLFMGIPADTNLCYHDPDAGEAFAALVLDYARKNPRTDYIHIWLADEYNNLCECPDCRQTTLSDQYVAILNEIDRRLTAEGLKNRLVFLLYQELLWPPVKERLKNPDRFVLMFAPISRTFERSYELYGETVQIPEFHRNHITLPTSLPENIAFLRGWQDQFKGDSFIYDYPLGRAHYGDFGYVRLAEVIYGDIQKLGQLGLNGYISCQEFRAALPNAFPNYVMARTLFEKEASLEVLKKEYFSACYGPEWEKVLHYLTKLSELSSCDYVNGKGARINSDIAERMERVRGCCQEFAKETAFHRNEKEVWENSYWKILEYHRKYIILFSEALYELASGNQREAAHRWEKMREFICRNEPSYQPYLDVYRVLEVTRKYTGFSEKHRNNG